jgi:hypothetical protein
MKKVFLFLFLSAVPSFMALADCSGDKVPSCEGITLKAFESCRSFYEEIKPSEYWKSIHGDKRMGSQCARDPETSKCKTGGMASLCAIPKKK